jgi:CheY-like chemotaxis protein
MKGKILIVDDEPQIRRVLKAALSPEDYLAVEAKICRGGFSEV